MKTTRTSILIFLLLANLSATYGQTSPSERRAFRQYTSPEELVSLAATTPLDRALQVISEVTQKFFG
ncbi:MAG: hypothetical protein HY708_00360 [Ignavibacteriae bacterium]|nr:hypothetical protein [Ignavibacteriota bacterium]